MTPKSKRTRAPNGASETEFKLRLPLELRQAAKKAAKAEGIQTESEWWRRAGRKALSEGT